MYLNMFVFSNFIYKMKDNVCFLFVIFIIMVVVFLVVGILYVYFENMSVKMVEFILYVILYEEKGLNMYNFINEEKV